MNKRDSKTLVLGLGNPILSDDGIGCHIALILKAKLKGLEGIDIVDASIAGLDFLELLSGYDRAIIIDAIQTKGGTPGQIYRLKPDVLSSTRHAASPHDVNLATALELGRKLGLPLPQEITLFGITAEDVTSFSEECTPMVKKAIPACLSMIMQELHQGSLPG